MNTQTLLGLGSLFASGADIAQATQQHVEAMKIEQQQHEEEMQQMRDLHAQELHTARQTYLLSTYTDIEQYCQELNENLLNSTREAERDMVDQRNQQFQTILIAATMMLTALLSVLYQGLLPTNSPQFYFVAYSVTNTASLLVLLVCVWLCLVLTSRIHKFMYGRSREANAHLTAAMDQTKRMMRHIRGDALALVRSAAEQERTQDTLEEKFRVRKNITKLAVDELEEEWSRHEEEVYKYLQGRNRINEQMERLATTDHLPPHRASSLSGSPWRYRLTFETYWSRHCRSMANWTLVCFYLGTTLMLLATLVYVCASFLYSYHSLASMVVSLCTLGVSLVVCLGLAVYLRFFDRSIEHRRSSTDAMSPRGSISNSNSSQSNTEQFFARSKTH